MRIELVPVLEIQKSRKKRQGGRYPREERRYRREARRGCAFVGALENEESPDLLYASGWPIPAERTTDACSRRGLNAEIKYS